MRTTSTTGLAKKGEEKVWKQTKKKNLMTYLHLTLIHGMIMSINAIVCM